MTTLWRHQEQAVQFALQMGSCGIFYGMGSGKTRIGVEIAHSCKSRLTLIVAPKPVMDDGVWGREFAAAQVGISYEPLTNGTSQAKAAKLRRLIEEYQGRRLAVIVNYDSLWRSQLGTEIMKAKWECIILDEAHRIKAAGSRVSRFAHMLAKHHPLAYRVALTGTPTPNSPLDVYGLCRFIDDRVFGTNFSHFSSEYAYVGGPSGFQVLGFKNLDGLRKKLASLSITATSDDLLDLPAALHIRRETDLEPDATKLYADLTGQFTSIVQGAGTITVDNILTLLVRMQQISSGCIPLEQPDGTTKMHVVSRAKEYLLQEVLEEMPTRIGNNGQLIKEPVVIFCRFLSDIDLIKRVCKELDLGVSEYSGRDKQLQEWKDGWTDVLAAQIHSGSEGIDLTRAKYAVYLSKTFSYGEYEQSMARIRRPGQTADKVRYIHLVVRGTIDEDLEKSMKQKKNLITYIQEALREKFWAFKQISGA